MSLFQAVFLGLLQGFTEFLPVSSSGHLVIAQHYLGGISQPGVLFDILLHFGTMGAVLLYFRRDCVQLAMAPFRSSPEAQPYRRLLALLVIGSVPTAVIGLLFKDFFVGLFHNLTLVALMLLVTGSLLFLSERLRFGQDKDKNKNKNKKMTILDALLVGTIQGGAIIPGISRSGSTIAGLLFRGVDGETAARFSFLLALPAIFGAGLLSLGDLSAVSSKALPVYLVGMLIAFLTGLVSIHWLMAVVRRRRLYAFALYCWLMGFTILILAP
jgi:undecaprenyl-diphosphatase